MDKVTTQDEGFATITITVPKSLKDRLVVLTEQRGKELNREVTMKEILVTDLMETLKKFGV